MRAAIPSGWLTAGALSVVGVELLSSLGGPGSSPALALLVIGATTCWW